MPGVLVLCFSGGDGHHDGDGRTCFSYTVGTPPVELPPQVMCEYKGCHMGTFDTYTKAADAVIQYIESVLSRPKTEQPSKYLYASVSCVQVPDNKWCARFYQAPDDAVGHVYSIRNDTVVYHGQDTNLVNEESLQYSPLHNEKVFKAHLSDNVWQRVWSWFEE